MILTLLLLQITPTFGVIMVSLLTNDWNLLTKMNWRITRKYIIWLFISLILPVLIITNTSLIMGLFNSNYIPHGYSNKLLIITIIVSFIGCVGEEIGWRGFMMPLFNKKYSLLISAIFTGILWGAWHLGKLTSYGVLGYFLFIILIVEFSLIMAWIYTKTKGNMLSMVLFHFGINTTALILLTDREGILFYSIAGIICGIVSLFIIILDKKTYQSIQNL